MSSAMPAPVCLIENEDSGTLSVRKEGKDILDRINGPVVVVSVVGLYRTGKSYLMNRLAQQQTGFALGNTVESKTKGIWMWCVPHPSMPGHTLVLLDTEGLGDVKKGDSKNDGWIFCLAVLLSSTVVYNSRGTIDNNAVEQLHYVAELAEQIKIKSPSSASEEDEEGEENFQFVCFFPSFVWAVRDFTLDLEIKGKKATEDEYLNYALGLKKGAGKKISDYNMPRECIRSYFPSRKCFVFPSPASPENMRCLESLQEQDLVPGFMEATHNFCKYIFVKSAVKKLKGGHTVTGKMLGQLAHIYVKTINDGQVPCLENAVVALANLENQTAVEEALKVYKSGMEEITSKFPVGMDSITIVHQKCSSQANSEFMKRSFKDDKAEYISKLKEEMDIYYAGLLIENETASEKKCKELLKKLFSNMSERLQNGAYSQPGGYEVYCKDRDDIVAQYRGEQNKGVRAEAVLNEFLNERGPEANSILYADKKLTENDRKIQEEKEKAALLEQKCKEEEEKRIESERMREAEQERQEDRMRQMQEKFNKEMEQQREEMDKAMDSKLKEQEELLSKGFKEKAELLNEEIKSLQKEKESINAGGIFKDYVMPILATGADLLSSLIMHKSIAKGLKALKGK
ncbi:guanylate-binding protein 1-like isoform X4 [Paramisgurnus dabryanus]|uniref:guanylate-binding protein 1-like isoform X4 n=1 Tax=Paramisgurnus dabryanus TaxID=90735 RepID=UPI0031F366CF